MVRVENVPKRPEIKNWRRHLFGVKRLPYYFGATLVIVVLILVLRDAPVDRIVQAMRDTGPLTFFAAMAVLPVIGFPVTPFYLLAGATFGVWTSLIGTAIAQAINLFLAYWLARRYLRAVVEWLVRRTRYEIPEIKRKNYINFCILVKVTPGPPNFLKSFILGLARIPFGIFFLISWPTTMGFAVGVIIFGDSLMDKNLGQAIVGFLLMGAFLVAIKIVGDRVTKRQELREAENGGDEEGERRTEA